MNYDGGLLATVSTLSECQENTIANDNRQDLEPIRHGNDVSGAVEKLDCLKKTYSDDKGLSGDGDIHWNNAHTALQARQIEPEPPTSLSVELCYDENDKLHTSAQNIIKIKKQKQTPRRWSESEEKIFIQSCMDGTGKKISRMLDGSRGPRDVASHAQKHFIKLYKVNKALPERVRQSGEGYTLSGKPLNPGSAAARAYGLQGPEASRLYRSSQGVTTAEPIPVSKKILDKLQSASVDENRDNVESRAVTRQLAARRSKKVNAAKKKPVAHMRRMEKKSKFYGDDHRTVYSRKRNRRKASSQYEPTTNESLSFVQMSSYEGPIASGGSSQPFRVLVHSNVYATVDLHAHTSMAEIIGLLGGRLDYSTLTISVEKAFPGKSLLDGRTECEMDPVVEVALRDEIRAHGLIVVGWYHSHPTFDCIPSNCDVNNQVNYQALFRDDQLGMGPFIGLIFTPYDPRLPSEHSQYEWFYVESIDSVDITKRIDTDIVCEARLPEDTIERMGKIVETAADEEAYGVSEHLVKFDEVWRQNADGELITFLVKLRRALESWMPPAIFRLQLPESSGKEDNISTDREDSDQDTEAHSAYANEVLDSMLLRLNV